MPSSMSQSEPRFKTPESDMDLGIGKDVTYRPTRQRSHLPWRVNRVTPKWNPGKWKHGQKPVVFWRFNFDPYPLAFKAICVK